MKKEEFRQAIADAELRAAVADDLLATVETDHFTESFKGVLNRYNGKDPHGAAFWWISNHYEGASAAISALAVLVNDVHEMLGGLWTEAGKLIPDEWDAVVEASEHEGT